MEVKILVPNEFGPDQKQFRAYCALKLYEAKKITKKEAMKMIGLSDDEESLSLFNFLCKDHPQHYRGMCDRAYSQSAF